jgi:lincosamide nucleotidyltransferase B/F
VFEPQELQEIPFAAGRIVWKHPDAPETIHKPPREVVDPARRDRAWLLGEALTNIYIGLGRDRRGEKLSAARFIQWYAVDRLLELAEYIEPEQRVARDIFANERRFEQRYPGLAHEVPAWMQGYERNRESALAILSFLEQHFEINPALAEAIRAQCG